MKDQWWSLVKSLQTFLLCLVIVSEIIFDNDSLNKDVYIVLIAFFRFTWTAHGSLNGHDAEWFGTGYES